MLRRDIHLKDYLEGKALLKALLHLLLNDFHYISGGSGFSSVMEWSEEMFYALIHCFEKLQKKFDFILFDMGAGATNWSLDLIDIHWRGDCHYDKLNRRL